METSEKELESIYRDKAKDSFKTKFNLFLYDRVASNALEFTLKDFQDFKITQELVNEYTTIYWQERKEYSIRGKKIEAIEKGITLYQSEFKEKIKELKIDYVAHSFPEIFPKGDFEVLRKNKKCCYCGITEVLIDELIFRKQIKKKSARGFKLEVERFNSNFEYTPDNCSMCCYWCNNAKTDEFTATEFWLAGKIIGTIWDKRFRDSRENNDAEEGISLDELETIKDYQLKAYQKYSQSKSMDSSIKDQSEK